MRPLPLPLVALLLVACAAPGEPLPAPAPDRTAVAEAPVPAAAVAPPVEEPSPAGDLGTPGEWDRELPPEVRLVDDDEHGATHAFVRVVDDRTGAPMAGATIDGWWEAAWPHAESWEALREQRVVTDLDGWAAIRTFEGGQWWYVESPGYAPFAQMGLDEGTRLEPGVDVPIEVRDWLDRPRAGVEVELLLGCGHTPAVRTVVTDARGRAVLRCVKPGAGTLWLRGEGLRGLSEGYSSDWGDLPVEDGHRVLHAEPAPVYEGVVLYHDGTPAADAAVGGHDSHRGPWTATDAEGRFRLVGLGDDDVTIQAWPYPGGPEDAEGQWGEGDLVPGVPAVIRLDPPDWVDLEEEEEATVPLRLRVRAVLGTGGFEEPIDDAVEVLAVREGDGLVEGCEPWVEGTEGLEEVEIPPGRWELRWGSPTGPFREARRTVTVGPEGGEVTLDLRPNATWSPTVVELDADGFAHPYADVEDGVFTVLAATGVESTDADDLPLYVPFEGPFAVVFEALDDRRTRVVLDAPPMGEGPLLVLPPVDEAPEESPLMTLPYEGDFAESTLTVLLPGGSPAADADITVRGSFSENMSYAISGSLDAAGMSTESFRSHDEVTVTVDEPAGLPPLVARITEPGPWTLRWPEGVVALRVVDAAGAPVTTAVDVQFEGTSLWLEEGRLNLLGLPTGPVRFQVAAPGYLPHDVRLILTEGEHRNLTLTLHPR